MLDDLEVDHKTFMDQFGCVSSPAVAVSGSLSADLPILLENALSSVRDRFEFGIRTIDAVMIILNHLEANESGVNMIHDR